MLHIKFPKLTYLIARSLCPVMNHFPFLPLLSPWQPPSYYFFEFNFFIFHMEVRTYSYLSSSVLCHLLPSRSRQVTTYGKISFLFMIEEYSSVSVYHSFFAHIFVDGTTQVVSRSWLLKIMLQ